MHSACFAPAFTLSLCDSEYARKPPVPIASGVRCKRKKKTNMRELELKIEKKAKLEKKNEKEKLLLRRLNNGQD